MVYNVLTEIKAAFKYQYTDKLLPETGCRIIKFMIEYK